MAILNQINKNHISLQPKNHNNQNTIIMKKTIIITCLLIGLQTQAQSDSNALNGPNDCLIQAPGSCPVEFLKEAFCYRDTSVCSFLHHMDSIRFYDALFIQAYRQDIFPELNLIQAARILSTSDQQTLHEIFEYSICLVSPDSCYADGASGLTIYHTPITSEECPPNDNNCHGGPSDAKICQVTPEACTFSGN